MNKNEIDVKIEKGKKISEILYNIDKLEHILSTLNNDIVVIIGVNSNCNLMKYNIFSTIVWKHIDEIKIDVSKAIYKLKEELDTLIK